MDLQRVGEIVTIGWMIVVTGCLVDGNSVP